MLFFVGSYYFEQFYHLGFHFYFSSELNRLWNIYPDNLGACREKTRDFMPSIETYFAEAMKELDQEPVVPFDPKREVKPKK